MVLSSPARRLPPSGVSWSCGTPSPSATTCPSGPNTKSETPETPETHGARDTWDAGTPGRVRPSAARPGAVPTAGEQAAQAAKSRPHGPARTAGARELRPYRVRPGGRTRYGTVVVLGMAVAVLGAARRSYRVRRWLPQVRHGGCPRCGGGRPRHGTGRIGYGGGPYRARHGRRQTCTVPSTLPDGDPVPASGRLPDSALQGLGGRPFGFYVHVPFCVTRCGYCDFNTYTASELGPGASHKDYADTAIDEVRRARANLGDVDLPVETVFFGGGTPTLLPAGDLVRILGAIEEEFGLAAGVEVTTEANPESVDPAYLAELRAGGLQQDELRHAERPRARAPGAGPPAHAGPAGAGRAGGEGGGIRPRQPGPDLRHAGGERRRLARLAGRGDRGRARPRVGLLADRGGRHPAGRAGSAAASCRCPTTTCPPTATCIADAHAGRGRVRMVRGVQLGDLRGRRAAGTTCCTGPAATGGASAPARTATSAGCAGGTSSTPRPTPQRLAAGTSPAHAREVLTAEDRTGGAVDAGAAGSSRASRSSELERPAAWSHGRWPTACWRRSRSRRAARCSRCAGACWPTRWSATSPERRESLSAATGASRAW